MFYYEKETGQGRSKTMDRDKLESTASALYDGGWRAEEKIELMNEHNLTDEDAEDICDLLAVFATRTWEE